MTSSTSKGQPRELFVPILGTRRRLLRFEERPDGTIIVLLPKGLSRDLAKRSDETGSPAHNRPVRQRRISIHPSLNSTNEINVLKDHYEIEGDSVPRVFRHYTSALKRFDNLAHVVSIRFPKIGDDAAIVDHASVLTGLPPIDERGFTLVLSVYVCNRSRIFDHLADPHVVYRRIDFRMFSLILLSSYLSVEGNPFSEYTGSLTYPGAPEDLGRGVDGMNIFAHFNFELTNLRSHLLRLIPPGMDARKHLAFLNSRYFGQGLTMYEDFQKWLASPSPRPLSSPFERLLGHIAVIDLSGL